MLRLDDPTLEAERQRKMSPSAQQALRAAFGVAVETQELSLMEIAPATTLINSTTVRMLTPALPQEAARTRVTQEEDLQERWRS